MINLCVESYCQNCPYFEPVTEKVINHYLGVVDTAVYCKDMNKCDVIHNQILEDEAKKVADAKMK